MVSDMHTLTSAFSHEDHILPGRSNTNNSSDRSRRARNSSVVTNPWEKEELNLRGGSASTRTRSDRPSKWSPTPSIKKRTVENFVKTHGSPPNIRVTCGGRIVPNDLSPLASPRFDYPGQQKSDYSRAPANNASPVAALHNGWIINSGDGRIGQIVDGEVRPLEWRNDGSLQLYMPAPNLPTQTPFFPYGPLPAMAYPPMFAPSLMPPPAPFVSNSAGGPNPIPTPRELRIMEQAHAKLEQELKDLNRNEVLNQRKLNVRQREEIVKSRIELTQRIDESRRAIAEAKKMIENPEAALQQQVPVPGDAFYGPPPPPLTYSATDVGFHDGPQPPQSASDPKVFLARYNSNDRHHPQQGFPEFVPRQFQVSRGIQASASNAALRERNSNINAQSVTSSKDEHASSDTVKGFGHGDMGLDGSMSHRRRSHAVTIKDPNDGEVKSKTALNPASPSYQPKNEVVSQSEGHEDDNAESMHLSPRIVAEMESLVHSPRQQQPQSSSSETHQASDTSVNTTDFFPLTYHEHSSKYTAAQRDAHHKSARWMPREGDPEAQKISSTPFRLPTKFMFSDDSPTNDHISYTEATLQQGSPRQSHLRESTVVTDDLRYGRGQKSSVPVSELLNHVSERAASIKEPAKETTNETFSSTYLAGFEMGLRQEVLTGAQDDDFRRGYRDGLVKSVANLNSAQINERQAPVPNAAPPQLDQILANGHRTTFDQSPAVCMPEVPANSLATTPTRERSKAQQRGSSGDNSLDSPIARAGFEAQPNITLSGSRAVGTQTFAPRRHDSKTGSPVSKRHNGEASPADMHFVASKLKELGNGYDQQRYMSKRATVGQNNDQASGYFPLRFDGSGGNEKPLEVSTNIATPMSPTIGSSTGVSNVRASGSPVRRKASAAVATMKQVAGIGAPKGDSPVRSNSKREPDIARVASPPSPEKRAWREKFGFRQVKRDEQEVEGDKNFNPLRYVVVSRMLLAKMLTCVLAKARDLPLDEQALPLTTINWTFWYASRPHTSRHSDDRPYMIT